MNWAQQQQPYWTQLGKHLNLIYVYFFRCFVHIFEEFYSFHINICMHMWWVYIVYCIHTVSQKSYPFISYTGCWSWQLTLNRIPFKLWAVLCEFTMISSRQRTISAKYGTHSFTWLERSHSHVLRIRVCEPFAVHEFEYKWQCRPKIDKGPISVVITTIAHIKSLFFENKNKVLDSLGRAFYAHFIAIWAMIARYTIAITVGRTGCTVRVPVPVHTHTPSAHRVQMMRSSVHTTYTAVILLRITQANHVQ